MSSEVGPWDVGRLHEQSASKARRRKRGAFYTPRSVVEGLLRHAIPDGSAPPSAVLDPTCGGGAFLVGAADRLVDCGLSPSDALGRMWAIDIDTSAVEAARHALSVWAGEQDLDPEDAAVAGLSDRIVAGDALRGLPKQFPRPMLVVGNPPFSTPLKGSAFPKRAVKFRTARPELFGPYVDLAGIHLQAAVEHCDDGGSSRVAFVLPQSILASRDSSGMRTHLDEIAPMELLWSTSEQLFEANVEVCALILGVGSGPAKSSATICRGATVEPIGVARKGEPWASLAARALGAPGFELDGPPLGERVRATAGFRDEYYALATACRELADMPAPLANAEPIRIATVGSLDPLQDLWGIRPTRFAKKTWQQPVVDMSRLDGIPRITTWLHQQLRPKVLLPTQSKVFEPVIDRAGCMAPVTPVLAVHADADDLDHVAAMFLAPPLVAWAYRRWFGTALSVSAIKVAARDVPSFPTPADHALWDRAAELVAALSAEGRDLSDEDRVTALTAIASLMNDAYRGPHETLTWWIDRLLS